MYFLENDRCKIHAAKPLECVFSHHSLHNSKHEVKRMKIVNKWVDYQNQIQDILGRKPVVPENAESIKFSLRSFLKI